MILVINIYYNYTLSICLDQKEIFFKQILILKINLMKLIMIFMLYLNLVLDLDFLNYIINLLYEFYLLLV